MKKNVFFTIISFLGIIMNINAQSLEFIRNGQVIPDGTIINITEPINSGELSMKMDAEIFIHNPDTESVGAVLNVCVLEGEEIAICGFDNNVIGQCVAISSGYSITKPMKEGAIQPERTVKANESIDPEVHTLSMIETYNPLTFKKTFKSTVKYELTYGSITKTVTVKFNYDATDQSLDFIRNGQAIPNGTIINITEPINSGEPSMKMDAEILIHNPGTESVGAVLTVSVLEGEALSICGFDNGVIGQCVDIPSGSSVTKPMKEGAIQPKRTVKANESIDPQVHTMSMVENWDPLTFKKTFKSTVKYELTYGSTTKTVTVKFNYNAPNEKLTQNIVWNQFNGENSKLAVNNEVILNAYATSGLPVTYSANSDIVRIEGNKLIALRKGEVIITATQEGNNVYKKTSTSENIQINPATPIIRISDCIQTYSGENKRVTIATEPNNLYYTVKYTQGTFEVKETTNADVYYVTVNINTDTHEGEAYSWLIINKAPQIIIWNQEEPTLEIGEKIKLEAKNTTSFQNIEYYSEDTSIAEIITLDGQPYIIGKEEGHVKIMAHLKGNNNYEESAEIRNFKIKAPSSIKNTVQTAKCKPSIDNEILTLEGILNGSKITLMNINGNIILSQIVNEDNPIIDMSTLSQGIYLLSIQDKQKHELHKIVKE